MRKTLTLLLLTCFLALPLFAAEGPPVLFELRPDVHAAEGVGVDLDLARLLDDPARLVLPLPDGRRVVATRNYVEQGGEGRLSWFGDLEGAVDGSVSFHLHDGELRGGVRLADGVSYLLSGEAGAYRLVEADAAAGAACGLPEHEHDGFGAAVGGLQAVTAGLDSTVDCAGLGRALVYVDVMVLYPHSLAGQASQVQSYAAAQIAESNNIFFVSRSRVRYRLAAVKRITGVQPPSGSFPTQAALNWLNGQFSGAPNTEVELLAKAYAADMIAVVVPPHPNTNCGIGNLPELNTSGQEVMHSSGGPMAGGTPFNQRAFMAVELNCGLIDYTFAHELGHAFGMRHDVESRGADEILPWAYGYIIPNGGNGEKATVMGCVGNALPCFRQNLFSTPGVTVDGQPAGVHNFAYNACVADLRSPAYAAHRQPPPSQPPSLAIASPADGAAVAVGQSFQLFASASDPEDGNLAGSVQWVSDRDGSLGSGSPRTVSLSTPGQHLITAKVSDSNGTQIWYSIRLSVTESDPPLVWVDFPSHAQTVSGNFLVRGWATDASGVVSMSFKVDGVPVTLSGFVYGTSRGDVCAAHPIGDPNCPNVGFQGTLDTSQLANGGHTLSATAFDPNGNSATFNRFFQTSNVSNKFFLPTDDAWVNSQAPNTNYGNDTQLAMRSHDTGLGRHAYFKFTVSGITRPVSQATLRLVPAGSTMTTCQVYRLATTSWQEETITWNNAPLDPLLSFQAPCAGSPIQIDVSPIITGNGTFTIGMVTPNVPGQAVHSKEGHPFFVPELTVTY